MTAHCRRPDPRPQPLYFCECHYGKLGTEFEALDRDKNSRAEIVRQIRNGGINPVKVLEVIEPCEDFPRGQVLNVTTELVEEARQQRDPPEIEELRQRLIDLARDGRRDYLKHEVWT